MSPREVWVAEELNDYEPGHVLGVFSDEAGALDWLVGDRDANDEEYRARDYWTDEEREHIADEDPACIVSEEGVLHYFEGHGGPSRTQVRRFDVWDSAHEAQQALSAAESQGGRDA